MAAHGIDTGAVSIFECIDDAGVAAALEALFAAPEPPTALLAQSDRIAMAALEWLKAGGIAVPGEVSIVGFDGVPEAAGTEPPLTTVSQPIAELGRRAVKIILDHPQEVRPEALAVELVLRASTGPPPRLI